MPRERRRRAAARRAARSSPGSREVAPRFRPEALAPLETQSAALAVIVVVVIVALVSWAAAAVIGALYVLLSLALRQMRRPTQR